jgi:hypothetical protein
LASVLRLWVRSKLAVDSGDNPRLARKGLRDAAVRGRELLGTLLALIWAGAAEPIVDVAFMDLGSRVRERDPNILLPGLWQTDDGSKHDFSLCVSLTRRRDHDKTAEALRLACFGLAGGGSQNPSAFSRASGHPVLDRCTAGRCRRTLTGCECAAAVRLT